MSHAQKALSTTPILKIWGKGCPIHVTWAQIAKALATRAVQAGIYFTFLGRDIRESHHSRMMTAATHRLWQVDVSFSSSGGCSVVQLMMIHDDDIWFLHKLAEDCNTISSSINNSCTGQATGELLVGVPLWISHAKDCIAQTIPAKKQGNE